MLDSCVTNRFQYDKNLLLWLVYTGNDNQVWYITSDIYRNEYQLWKDSKKTKYTSDNPEDLYEHIKDKGHIYERKM